MEKVEVKVQEIQNRFSSQQRKENDFSKRTEDLQNGPKPTIYDEYIPASQYDSSPIGAIADKRKLDDGRIAYVEITEHGARDFACNGDYHVKTYNDNFSNTGMPHEFKGMQAQEFNTSMYEDLALALRVKKQALNYIDRFQELSLKGKWLFIHSPVSGSGKTRLACSIGNSIIKKYGATTNYIESIKFIEDLKAKKNIDAGERSTIYTAISPPCLIWDNVGAEKLTDFVNTKVYEILTKRINQNRINIFTSQYLINELEYMNTIKSILKERCLVISIPNEDIRGKIAVRENERYMELLSQ
jgi:DNA replication protein DnaC